MVFLLKLQVSVRLTGFTLKFYSLQPDGLSVSVTSSTTTYLTISWALEESLSATSYSISYSATDTDCFTDSNTIFADGTLTMYTLTGLEEGTEYSITVTATLTGGGSEEDTITFTTIYAGESSLLLYLILSLSQLHLPLPLL